MSLLSEKARDALDRMDEVGTCWAAISDLMVPGGDLQDPQKDNLAILTRFLGKEYEAAREAFSQAIRQ